MRRHVSRSRHMHVSKVVTVDQPAWGCRLSGRLQLQPTLQNIKPIGIQYPKYARHWLDVVWLSRVVCNLSLRQRQWLLLSVVSRHLATCAELCLRKNIARSEPHLNVVTNIELWAPSSSCERNPNVNMVMSKILGLRPES